MQLDVNLLVDMFNASSLKVSPTVVLVILAVSEALWCFFGLKLVRIWAAILGFFIGGGLGVVAASQFALERTAVVIIGIIAGIVFAGLGAVLYRVGIFVVAFAAGSSLGAMLFKPTDITMVLVCLGIGLVLAMFTVSYAEPVIIVVTALYGAVGLGTLIGSYLPFDFLENDIIQYVVTFVIFVLGVWLQFLWESGKRKKQSLRKAEEIREKHSAENEVEKARALMENLDNLQEEKEEE